MKTATGTLQVAPTINGTQQLAGALRRDAIEEIECGECGSEIEVLVMKPCRCGSFHGSLELAGR